MRDPKALTVAKYHQVEDVEPIPQETKERVRRLICAHAQGEDLDEQVTDAEVLMMALGIHPTQDDDTWYVVKPALSPNAINATPPRMLVRE
jgi:hypothetical protein